MSDIEVYKPTLTCFEIGSRGYVSPRQPHQAQDTAYLLQTRNSTEKVQRKYLFIISFLILCYLSKWFNPGYVNEPFMHK